MGIKDWFGRGPKDYNEQLIQEAEAQRQSQDQREAKAPGKANADASGWSGGDSGPAATTYSTDKPPTIPGGAPLAGEALKAEILTHVREGNKIVAIKVFRDATGLGLKESKDAVEAIAAGRDYDLPPPRPVTTASEHDVEALARSGQAIQAIKLYRELHGVGLKEAKDAVDAMLAAG